MNEGMEMQSEALSTNSERECCEAISSFQYDFLVRPDSYRDVSRQNEQKEK
jgi:hypothetical protein